jgi:hypothetical protein
MIVEEFCCFPAAYRNQSESLTNLTNNIFIASLSGRFT